MNKLAAYWEKIVLGIVVLFAILVVVIKLTGGVPVPELATQRAVTSLSTNDLDLYNVIITRAKSPVPDVLAFNYFAHPWLQYCTACKKLQPHPQCMGEAAWFGLDQSARWRRRPRSGWPDRAGGIQAQQRSAEARGPEHRAGRLALC
ncbi:MAG: hypothetical protein NTV22_20135 [bacterium]|nr:hypothetical protein [bacterium]